MLNDCFFLLVSRVIQSLSANNVFITRVAIFSNTIVEKAWKDARRTPWNRDVFLKEVDSKDFNMFKRATTWDISCCKKAYCLILGTGLSKDQEYIKFHLNKLYDIRNALEHGEAEVDSMTFETTCAEIETSLCEIGDNKAGIDDVKLIVERAMNCKDCTNRMLQLKMVLEAEALGTFPDKEKQLEKLQKWHLE